MLQIEFNKLRCFPDFIAILLLLICSCSHLQSQEFKKVGYLPTYRFSLIDDIEFDKLTHLNIAFANPDANGLLSTNGVDITPIVERAHEADLEVFIALAGGAAQLSDWEEWIKPNNRSAFIQDIIDYTLSHNLQGIDVDLEWGNVNDDYSGFVLELRDSIDQYDLGYSVAFPGTYRYPEVSDEALFSFDWVNLMVYDLTGPWQPSNPGPHSPYSFAFSSIDYWEALGLDKSDMTLGVPFYGYDFTNQSNVSSVRFSDMVALDPAYAQLDQVGQIYYNGLMTIEQKTQLAFDELSGIMIWELGQDSFDEFSLLNRINETIDANLTSTDNLQDQKKTAKLYPNPTSAFTTLRFDEAQDCRIVLYSGLQEIHLDRKYNKQQEIVIDLSGFPSGMYFLFVEGEALSGTFKVARF